MLATIIVWYLATAGLAAEVVGMLIPWSLGLIDKIDPLVARTYFWWFGHPLRYFWLLPACVICTMCCRKWLALFQRSAGQDGVRPVRGAVHTGGIPSPVRRPGDHRRLEVRAHDHGRMPSCTRAS